MSDELWGFLIFVMVALTTLFSLQGCVEDKNNPSVITEMEQMVLDSQTSLNYYYPSLEESLNARSVNPGEHQVPFCDVAHSIYFAEILNTRSDETDSISYKVNEIYESQWHKCIQDSKKGKRPPVSPPERLKSYLTATTMKRLADVAKVCNIAKVRIIQLSTKTPITELEANNIITECEWFKVQQELQK